ncbi:hypothetical protein ETQ85_07145 [Zoogloea oleivorans]|uniref:Uncharacterized protein n=1 Tax=Zoogloea oleivorans TaxID=1552750 RepID=A0A6C2D2S0_9RHOO|nr:hypothetical protein [Zoogloea oleivorans]TYC60264.1 hypothetical protein ETQ85_07145 [Zoogloea oleivorans]
MFQTHHSAIFPIQYDPNVRLWKWIEFGVDAPFFMLEIVSQTEDGDFVTHRMTSSLNVLRDHVSTSDAGVLKRVFLLSPGYVNGSDAFELDVLDSVCSSPSNPMKMLFKLTDGRTLHFSLGEEPFNESDYTVQVFKRAP